MRTMAVGDRAFFYHSNAKPPGIVGLMEVVETGITDPSQFDPDNKYFDPKSNPKRRAGIASAALCGSFCRDARP